MKPVSRLVFFLVILLALAIPSTALASPPGAPPQEDKVVFGGNYTLATGQALDGSLIVFGGNADVQKDAIVRGDVALIGGNLNINGTVQGSVILVGGNATLGDNAVVQGDVNTIGGGLHRAPGATIHGQVITGTQRPFQFDFPNRTIAPGLFNGIRPVTDLFFKVGSILWQSLALAALAILAVLFVPKQLERNASTATTQPWMSGGFGLLTFVVAPLLFVLIAITIILIPVSILGFILLALAAIFGWISIGVEVGKRLAHAFNQTWAPVISAGLGTFLMTLVVNSVGSIPCVGWLAPLAVSALGLGAVILTRFGTQSYPPAGVVSVTPVAPPDNPPATPTSPGGQDLPPAA